MAEKEDLFVDYSISQLNAICTFIYQNNNNHKKEKPDLYLVLYNYTLEKITGTLLRTFILDSSFRTLNLRKIQLSGEGASISEISSPLLE